MAAFQQNQQPLKASLILFSPSWHPDTNQYFNTEALVNSYLTALRAKKGHKERCASIEEVMQLPLDLTTMSVCFASSGLGGGAVLIPSNVMNLADIHDISQPDAKYVVEQEYGLSTPEGGIVFERLRVYGRSHASEDVSVISLQLVGLLLPAA